MTAEAPITITETGRIDRAENLTTQQRDAIRGLYRTLCHVEWSETRDGVVEDLIRRVKDGELSDVDAIQDAVTEACDGVLIYSQDCAEYLLASPNDEAWRDAYAGSGDVPEDYVRAALALEQDVREELDERGYGYNGAAWEGDCD